MTEDTKRFEIKGIMFTEDEVDYLKIKKEDGVEIVYQKTDKSKRTIGFGQNTG